VASHRHAAIQGEVDERVAWIVASLYCKLLGERSRGRSLRCHGILLCNALASPTRREKKRREKEAAIGTDGRELRKGAASFYGLHLEETWEKHV